MKAQTHRLFGDLSLQAGPLPGVASRTPTPRKPRSPPHIPPLILLSILSLDGLSLFISLSVYYLCALIKRELHARVVYVWLTATLSPAWGQWGLNKYVINMLDELLQMTQSSHRMSGTAL